MKKFEKNKKIENLTRGQGGRKSKNLKGLTLIEMLLGVAVMVILFGLSAVFYQSMQNKNSLNVAVSTVAQTLRRAQAISRAVQEDGRWGVYFQNGDIILFRGDSFLARDPDNDEITAVPASIAFTGVQEIVFDKLTGYPNITGSITLTSPSGETATVEVNEMGTVSY